MKLLSLCPNEFLSRKNNSIVKDALFDFILNSNKKTVTKSNNNSHLHRFSNQSVFTSEVYTLKMLVEDVTFGLYHLMNLHQVRFI